MQWNTSKAKAEIRCRTPTNRADVIIISSVWTSGSESVKRKLFLCSLNSVRLIWNQISHTVRVGLGAGCILLTYLIQTRPKTGVRLGRERYTSMLWFNKVNLQFLKADSRINFGGQKREGNSKPTHWGILLKSAESSCLPKTINVCHWFSLKLFLWSIISLMPGTLTSNVVLLTDRSWRGGPHKCMTAWNPQIKLAAGSWKKQKVQQTSPSCQTQAHFVHLMGYI